MRIPGERGGSAEVFRPCESGGGESFLRRLAAAGVSVAAARKEKDGVRFRVAAADLPLLRAAAAADNVHPRVVAFGGAVLFPRYLRRRLPVWVTLGLILVALLFVSSVSWRTEIVDDGGGLSAGEKREIAAAARKAGLKTPVLKSAVDGREIAHSLLRRCPDLSWAEVETGGVALKLHVAGRTEAETGPGGDDVVAAKDGVIKQLLVLRGQGRAAVGQTVRKGDVLISGHVVYEEEGREPVSVDTVAKGVVTAAVWYEGVAYVSLAAVSGSPGGAVTGSVRAEKDGAEVILFEGPGNDFDDFVTGTRRLSLFGWTVEAVSYRRSAPRLSRRKEERALAAAEKKAGNLAEREIPENAVIVGRQRRVLRDVPGAVGVAVTLETEEDIAVTAGER